MWLGAGVSQKGLSLPIRPGSTSTPHTPVKAKSIDPVSLPVLPTVLQGLSDLGESRIKQEEAVLRRGRSSVERPGGFMLIIVTCQHASSLTARLPTSLEIHRQTRSIWREPLSTHALETDPLERQGCTPTTNPHKNRSVLDRIGGREGSLE